VDAAPGASPRSLVDPGAHAGAHAGADAALRPVLRAVARVRARLRLQSAVRHFFLGLVLAAAGLCVGVVLYKLRLLSLRGLQAAGLGGGALAVLLAVVGALRRISPSQVAARIDKSHRLHDRLASALEFAHTEAGRGSQAMDALRSLAMQDAARVAEGIVPAVAAPWQRPQYLLPALALLGAAGLLGLIRPPVKKPVEAPRKKAAPPSDAPRLVVEPELLAPEKDELLRQLAEAERQGDEATAAILREMLKLLEQVEAGQLTRQQAFDQLSELEQRLMQGKEGALEDLQQKLRKAGSELGESKLAKDVGQALVKEDLDKAKAELKKLAEQALARQKGDKAQKDKSELAQALDAAARALKAPHDAKNDAKREDPNDPSRKKDEWSDKSQLKELEKKIEQLKEEERRLKKKLAENPSDEEAQRQLKKVQRELEQLEREKEDKKRELEKVERELKKQHEDLIVKLQKLRSEEQELKKRLEKNPKDEEARRKLEEIQKQMEELKEKAEEAERRLKERSEAQKAEERTQRMQELRDEERRLKKKLAENPNDEESQRQLKKTQRELEQLEREQRERDEARRELEQLERDMQRAAEEMRKQLEKMTPEQRQAMEQLQKDLSRMQDEIRKLQKQQKGRGQAQMALGSIKTVLRRIARSTMGPGQGQGQQGPGQGQGQGKSMKDFLQRAKGQGQGEEVLVEGEGGKDGQQILTIGPGGDQTVILPGLGGPGGGKGGQEKDGQGGPGGGKGGDGAGTQHDPNLQGDPTQLNGNRKLTKVTGKEGAGPTRSETILGAAEKGFATSSYRRVYGDYTAVSEEVMSKQRVPPGYRFYVKRYFQMIKPRD
jgi:hypothetical protein